MKNVYRVSTRQHEDMQSGVLGSKNATILQARCASTMSCSNMSKVQLSPQTCKCDQFAHFCGCDCKTSKICPSANQIFHHQSRVATDSTITHQACTCDTLWRHRYVTSSKEYL